MTRRPHPAAFLLLIAACATVPRGGAGFSFPVAVSRTKRSGLTAPETTASPRPGFASMTAWRRRPVTGFAVKRTPATAASTIRWITTASRTVRWSMPFVAR